MAAPVFSVTLHHLAPGAKAAGLAYPDVPLPAVNAAQLRDLLYSMSEVAARLTIYEPSTPEIRVKTDRDSYVIRTCYRRLSFVGYETLLRGEDHSANYILSTITGMAEPAKAAPKIERFASASPADASRGTPGPAGRIPRWVKITVLAVLIIACNATAVWMLLRPTPTLAPHYDLLADPESLALLAKVAGEYRTGNQPGDRRLVIDPDGTLHLAKFGPQQAILDETMRSARGAVVAGRTALITSDSSVLAIKDADAVILYGSVYRRHNP